MEPYNLHKGYQQIFQFIHVTGSPNYWFEDEQWSPYVSNKTIHRISYFINLISYIFVASEVSAYITQKNLDFQQMAFLSVRCISHGALSIAQISLAYNKDVVTNVIWKLLVKCPGDYYDVDVAAAALKQTRTYVMASSGILYTAMLLYGVAGVVMLINDNTSGVVVSIWPQVDDRSTSANVGRIVTYILLGIWVAKIGGTFATVFCVTVCARHQYKHVQSHFRNLVNIFQDDNVSQEEKEIKYENGLKLGFMMHSKILSYTNEVVTICNVTYGAQILTNIAVFVLLMCRSFVGNSKPIIEILPDMLVILVTLGITGCFMTILGDLTIEAANIRDAMYCSGWENCGRASAVRVRKLLGVGMAQTQKPLIISLFGLVPVSHESYVSIVKASYSSFSLMYSTV